MKNRPGNNSHLEIRVHGIDGSVRSFVQTESDAAERTLRELELTRMFTQDRIRIGAGDSQFLFLPPLVARIDFISSRISIWDFPFKAGALQEATEEEFLEWGRRRDAAEDSKAQDDDGAFLDIETVGGQRAWLQVQLVAGVPAKRLQRLYSLLKEKQVMFGLRAGGIGILNPANVVRFVVHPDPSAPAASGGGDFSKAAFGKVNATQHEHSPLSASS